MNRWTVLLRSEQYGEEAFTYPTLDEALDGVRRLSEAASEERDDVRREISLNVRPSRRGPHVDSTAQREKERR